MKLAELIDASYDAMAENAYLRDCYRRGDPRVEKLIREKTARARTTIAPSQEVVDKSELQMHLL